MPIQCSKRIGSTRTASSWVQKSRFMLWFSVSQLIYLLVFLSTVQELRHKRDGLVGLLFIHIIMVTPKDHKNWVTCVGSILWVVDSHCFSHSTSMCT